MTQHFLPLIFKMKPLKTEWSSHWTYHQTLPINIRDVHRSQEGFSWPCRAVSEQQGGTFRCLPHTGEERKRKLSGVIRAAFLSGYLTAAVLHIFEGSFLLKWICAAVWRSLVQCTLTYDPSLHILHEALSRQRAVNMSPRWTVNKSLEDAPHNQKTCKLGLLFVRNKDESLILSALLEVRVLLLHPRTPAWHLTGVLPPSTPHLTPYHTQHSLHLIGQFPASQHFLLAMTRSHPKNFNQVGFFGIFLVFIGW